MRRTIKIIDTLLAIVCCVVFAFVGIGTYYLPNEYVSYDTNDVELTPLYSCTCSARAQSVDYQPHSSQHTLRFMHIVPVKSVSVTTKQAQSVYVSGEVFGIKLYTDGVIVVGTQSVELDDKRVNPAEQAGIQVGDIIVSINNTNVYSSDDVERILNDNNGLDYRIKIKRGERLKTFTLKPVFSQREGCYKAGMWVRDSTAGIGTITYYDDTNGTFGALGHQINDVDTNEIMPLLEGEAVSATVTSVQKGTSGVTGSLVCDFNEQSIGSLLQNNSCGIFGAYSAISERATKYPVASKQEISRGPAQIITTIDGNAPQKYDIEITHISYADKSNQQNMVIKVTDKRLIDATGGIVQGMSGSPIIQNGKLIGAVTHVIINNPQKGYAIFAQNMIECCK